MQKRPKVEREWDAFRQRYVGESSSSSEAEEDEAHETWVSSAKARRLALAEKRRNRKKPKTSVEEEPLEAVVAEKKKNTNPLVLEAASMPERNRELEEERLLLEEARRVQTNALQTAKEISEGVAIERRPLRVAWRPSQKAERMSDDEARKICRKLGIVVEGEDVPKPTKSFSDMALPEALVSSLASRKIKRPTPIQVQGIPVALAGRDLIGIAFTGSGKTLAFCVPLLARSLERENERPFRAGDGPAGLVLCPSRELAKQTFEVLSWTLDCVGLRATCAVGGEDKRVQIDPIRRSGVHAVVATPGRLADFLDSRAFRLERCCFLCLDEGDRMLDLGFDSEVKRIMNHFTQTQRQTLLFSATFPKTIQDFARETLVKPVVVNVSRAGAASLDVTQEVEYVAPEARIVALLDSLQKTAPPVVIFCERKGDVDDVHEYLLLKGIEAVAVHGGKDQAERNDAINLFKRGKRDVLVATDVAAKGLDFPQIRHVVNFDMPREIENYVHRIGRTGRCGKRGIATTFVNKNSDATVLLDLRSLLIEAKQKVPPVLQVLQPPQQPLLHRDQATTTSAECAYCGGLGHTILDCPKRDKDARKVTGDRRDMISASSGGYGYDW